jgi:hypothetical protein
MSYLAADDPNITVDINTRKEFASFKVDQNNHRKYAKNIIPRFMIDDQIQQGKYLQLHSFQLFVKNYINPNTPYSRLLIKWETGIGKTVGALAVALNFINFYQKEQRNNLEEIGTVFIIGFAERVFKNDLLKFPELGFITREEYKKMYKLKQQASTGSSKEIDKLRELVIKIKKRFTNRKGYGFFQFIGYKAFVNRIFTVNKDINLNTANEDDIDEYIKNGNIEVNKPLLKKFRNSLIICDEIHNVYNSLDKNNWGMTIQYVLDHEPTARAVFMSATPLNNSPTEIIDLLNLLMNNVKLNKEDFFDINQELKPGALNKIAKHCQGRISFLRDVNPKYFPRRRILGETIPGIDYLKFIRAPMSPFHYKTYKKMYTGAIPQDCQYIIDFALPNPDPDSDTGMYQTQVIKKSLNYASQKWKLDNKINFKEDRIVGSFMKKENIKKYSNKNYQLLECLHQLIKKDSGKVFIYHNNVHISGVLFIQEMLLKNGFLDEFGNSHDNTLCVICGKPRRQHTKKQLMIGGVEIENSLKIEVNDRGGSIFADGEIPLLTYRETDVIKISAGENIYNKNNEEKGFSPALDYLEKKGKTIFIQTLPSETNLHTLLSNKKYQSERHRDHVIYFKPAKFKKESSLGGNSTKFKKELFNSTKFKKELFNSTKFKKESSLGGNSAKKPENILHAFQAARFIVVHADIKSQVYKSLEKYNHSNNSYGHKYLILVGSKIVKESHDFKAIRNIFIMGRPDNIPMLKQIIGRAIRKNSHIELPIEKRLVDLKIFTSCLPTKTNGIYDLSYEEIKYREKMHLYKIIQNIEKVFHENAIDSIINKDTIKIEVEDPFQVSDDQKIAHYNMLKYEPNVPKNFLTRTFNLNELNLSTFDVFHYKTEIQFMMSIIKRLFVELSTVWTYDDLFKAVKFPPFSTEMNTKLFSKDLFCVTLSKLLWTIDSRYTEPYFEPSVGNFIEKILNPDDKYIIIPGGPRSVIVNIDKYYVLFPLDEKNEPIIDMDYCYRITPVKNVRKINLQGFMENISTLSNYKEKKERFYTKWKNVSIIKLEGALADFGVNFQTIFTEECIEYIFELWVKNAKKSYMHNFYLTMIYFYDIHNLIIWSSNARKFIADLYKSYITPVSLKLTIKQQNGMELNSIDDKQMQTSGVVNMLISSINLSQELWVPDAAHAHFIAARNRFNEFYDKIQHKVSKIPADILPIGHLLSRVPKFYHPDRGGWFESPEYMDAKIQFVENNLIVGYDEKIKNTIRVRFKVRPPFNSMSIGDSRKIERGSVCNSSKSKVFLKEVSKKLGITIKVKPNVNNLCSGIRNKLIYNELKERLNPKSQKKWFYFSYEKQPVF